MMEVSEVEGCREGALLSAATWGIRGTPTWLPEGLPAASEPLNVAGCCAGTCGDSLAAAVASASCRGLTWGVSPGAA